jgi:glycosyltransferase involved in cell wall biosynthesis
MIEALACATPVIAWPHGSVSEVIDPGRTGFIVDTVGEAVEAVRKIPALSRSVCRRVFEQRFDATEMARQYETVYQRLILESISPFERHSAAPVAETLLHG